MAKDSKPASAELVTSDDDVSVAQVTALVGSLMSGLQPLAKQQAEVQLQQIEASREQDARRFSFARTELFTVATVLIVVVGLFASAAAYLLVNRHEEEALRVIWFGAGVLGGFGFGKIR